MVHLDIEQIINASQQTLTTSCQSAHYKKHIHDLNKAWPQLQTSPTQIWQMLRLEIDHNWTISFNIKLNLMLKIIFWSMSGRKSRNLFLCGWQLESSFFSFGTEFLVQTPPFDPLSHTHQLEFTGNFLGLSRLMKFWIDHCTLWCKPSSALDLKYHRHVFLQVVFFFQMSWLVMQWNFKDILKVDNTFIFGCILPHYCISSYKLARDIFIFGHAKGKFFI